MIYYKNIERGKGTGYGNKGSNIPFTLTEIENLIEFKTPDELALINIEGDVSQEVNWLLDTLELEDYKDDSGYSEFKVSKDKLALSYTDRVNNREILVINKKRFCMTDKVEFESQGNCVMSGINPYTYEGCVKFPNRTITDFLCDLALDNTRYTVTPKYLNITNLKVGYSLGRAKVEFNYKGINETYDIWEDYIDCNYLGGSDFNFPSSETISDEETGSCKFTSTLEDLSVLDVAILMYFGMIGVDTDNRIGYTEDELFEELGERLNKSYIRISIEAEEVDRGVVMWYKCTSCYDLASFESWYNDSDDFIKPISNYYSEFENIVRNEIAIKISNYEEVLSKYKNLVETWRNK